MQPKIYPSQATLRRLFNYHPDGYLTWAVSGKGIKRLRAGYKTSHGYYQIMINQQFYKTHRLIWIWHNGFVAPNIHVDHIDNNKANNKISNLQLLTPSENTGKYFAANKPSGLPLYVRHNHGRFQARYKGETLGTFATVDEAVAAVEAVK